MQVTLHHPLNTNDCAPITDSQKLGDCLVANRKLKDLIATELQAVGFDLVSNELATARTVHLPVDHWIEVGALCLLARSENSACLRDKSGDVVAWRGELSPDDCEEEMITEADCFRIRYPWDLLGLNEGVLEMIDESNLLGDISPMAEINGNLYLGKGSKILPGVVIEGNVVIGENCRIGPNAFIRGYTSIGDACVIGNAVEIKNSLISSHTNIKHLSYVGDSIIGSHVHLGAGTIIANYRHDGRNQRSMVRGALVDTGREKFGAVIGDGVRTGVNTSIYPGRKIGIGRMTRPNTVVDKDLIGHSNQSSI